MELCCSISVLFVFQLKITTGGFQSPINLRNTDMELMTAHLHPHMRRNMNIKVHLGSKSMAMQY